MQVRVTLTESELKAALAIAFAHSGPLDGNVCMADFLEITNERGEAIESITVTLGNNPEWHPERYFDE